MHAMSSFPVGGPPFPSYTYCFQVKRGFGRHEKLTEDKKDGIVWGNIYPRAPPIDKTRRRMQQHRSIYINIKEQTGIPRSTVTTSDKV